MRGITRPNVGVQLRAARADQFRKPRTAAGPPKAGTRGAHGNQAPRAPTVSCNALLN
jgi:hypothetical protein